jgi:hypothetical protein
MMSSARDTCTPEYCVNENSLPFARPGCGSLARLEKIVEQLKTQMQQKPGAIFDQFVLLEYERKWKMFMLARNDTDMAPDPVMKPRCEECEPCRTGTAECERFGQFSPCAPVMKLIRDAYTWGEEELKKQFKEEMKNVDETAVRIREWKKGDEPTWMEPACSYNDWTQTGNTSLVDYDSGSSSDGEEDSSFQPTSSPLSAKRVCRDTPRKYHEKNMRQPCTSSPCKARSTEMAKNEKNE